MIEFIIPYPSTKAGKTQWAKEYGLNAIYAGKHWRKRQQDSQYWHLLIQSELRKQGIPKEMFTRQVEIRFRWNDNLDLDNHAYMGKMCVDSLKGYLIQDDTRRYIKKITHEWHDEDYILARIEEV